MHQTNPNEKTNYHVLEKISILYLNFKTQQTKQEQLNNMQLTISKKYSHAHSVSEVTILSSNCLILCSA